MIIWILLTKKIINKFIALKSSIYYFWAISLYMPGSREGIRRVHTPPPLQNQNFCKLHYKLTPPPKKKCLIPPSRPPVNSNNCRTPPPLKKFLDPRMLYMEYCGIDEGSWVYCMLTRAWFRLCGLTLKL